LAAAERLRDENFANSLKIVACPWKLG